jgi:hypothetical protein
MMKSRLPNPFLFVLIILVVAVITVLAFVTQQTSQPSKLAEGELKDVVITFERTSCYGSCPAYKLTIYGDGRVEYEGANNVKLKDKKEGRLQAAEVRNLVSEFDKANYSGIKSYTEDNCSCTLCTDMPTAITEFRAKGMSHRVEHYYGCRCAPKELFELEETIDRIARTEQWTGDVSKAGPFGTTCFNKQSQ